VSFVRHDLLYALRSLCKVDVEAKIVVELTLSYDRKNMA
jgi:hypothetical protein